ncbi:MAG: hypothetical protein IT331_17310 [Anaerolineae bacterium]|nr:hypothetical protein [Anaerolineae bacterium]
MSQLAIDAMDDASRWKGFAADGATPSAELVMTDDAVMFRYGADRKSGKVTGTTAALNHVLRRTLAATDLTNLDALCFWLKSSRRADGSPARPFFLEMRLASAAIGLDAPANTWSRLIPVEQNDTWEFVRLGLDDLPAGIRNAVTVMQVRCVNAETSFTANLDDMLAVRAEMIGDADAALRARLHEQLTLDGTKTPAVVFFPDDPAPPNPPFFRILNYDIRVLYELMRSEPTRADYSGHGFRLRASAVPYLLSYEIEAVADTRAHQTRMLEFALETLTPSSHLLVNGVMLPLEWVDVASEDLIGGSRTGRTLLHFQLMTWQERGAVERAVPPYHTVEVAMDQRLPTG